MNMSEHTSKQPGKQRKRLANAPLHVRHKIMSAALSKELKEKYSRNALPVRKGDTVEVMRGSMKGHKGKVMRVDTKTYKIFVEGVVSKKADGTDVERPIPTSNVRITELHEEDKERREVFARTMEAK